MKKLRIRQRLDSRFSQVVVVLLSVGVALLAAHSLLPTRAAPVPILGIDTSHWNATLNVTKLKSEGVVYQFMKATQGTTSNDSNFATTRTNAQNGGLIAGAYHFLNAGSGAAQCDHFIDRLNQTGGTNGIMLALDVELQTSTTGPSYTDVKNFLARCQPKTPGRTWVIYTGGWYWGTANAAGYLNNPPAPAGTVLWISIYVGGSGSIASLLDKVGAQGTSGDPYPSAKLNGWSDYAIRQFSASSTVAGVSPIDANVTYKGLDFLKKLAGLPTDITAPIVSITAPATGSNVTVGDSVAVAATATDNTAVTKVEFYVDGVLKSTDTASPYAYAWPTTGVTAGVHSLTAKALSLIHI